jgi:hypothetical protein
LQPEGDIYATRISENGTVLDPAGVPVASTNAPDDAPTLNFGHGITLLGYSTFNPAVTAGSMRVAVREIFSPLAIESSWYHYETDATMELDFTADVSGSFVTDDVLLTNLDTGAVIPPSAIGLSVNTWNDAVRITYTGPGGRHVLPNGDYRLTLRAGSIVSATGQTLTTDANIEFFVLAGDADHNGVINFDDYARIDNGFNNHLVGFSNGDFNYDGVVNFDDYALIDLAFNSQTAPLPASSPLETKSAKIPRL